MWLRRIFCIHKFRLGDQSFTKIPEPTPPPWNAGYDEWSQYLQDRDKHVSHTRRIQWPCAKCGKVFYAHCGLDILSRHGGIFEAKTDRP